MRIKKRFLGGGLIAGLVVAGAVFVYNAHERNDPWANRPPVTELERKVGQLILVGFDGTQRSDEGVRAVSAQLRDGKIGGVTVMSRNIEDAAQFIDLTTHLKAQRSYNAALIAVDQEGGRVQRVGGLDGAPAWIAPADMTLNSEDCDMEIATRYYTQMAAHLPQFNINLNFGPVVDVNINPENPVIGALNRSYSADPGTVARCAEAFVRGHQAAGVLTSLKHFPGHGSANEDSHFALPFVENVWDETELEPYQTMADGNLIDMIMMAHVVHSRFSDADDLPASLSRKGVSAARAIAGDDAVILTDCLEMDAISQRFTYEEAAVRALEAGNDMVILTSYGRTDPGLGDRINAAIVDAVKDGRLSLAKLEQSIERIENLKSRL
ncbi:MAG: glycoside hydrolase family 3 N-terminal domain-containing protein [Pseudomonadota bacterium]